MIAEEVLMGFGLHAGLTSVTPGFAPDLATLGKAIGSGISVTALVGRIARAGTYSGNPATCAAGVATTAELDRLDPTQCIAP